MWLQVTGTGPSVCAPFSSRFCFCHELPLPLPLPSHGEVCALRNVGPGLGLSPDVLWPFPGMLILPLSLGLRAIPEGLGGKSRAGCI